MPKSSTASKFKFGTIPTRVGVRVSKSECDGRERSSDEYWNHFAESPDCAAHAWFLNPATVHTIAVVDDVGVAAADRLNNSMPEDGTKATATVTVDGLRLEQETGSAVALKSRKRKPATDISLKADEATAEAATNVTVNTTLVVSAT